MIWWMLIGMDLILTAAATWFCGNLIMKDEYGEPVPATTRRWIFVAVCSLIWPLTVASMITASLGRWADGE